MALNVDDFPEFALEPESECDCEECGRCEQLEEVKVPRLIKLFGNIVALAFFLPILAYNIGVGYSQRKQFIIAMNTINETIGILSSSA